MVISFVVCLVAEESSGPVTVAFIITFVDALLPCLVREACSLERHHNAVSHDLSFMNKVYNRANVSSLRQIRDCCCYEGAGELWFSGLFCVICRVAGVLGNCMTVGI